MPMQQPGKTHSCRDVITHAECRPPDRNTRIDDQVRMYEIEQSVSDQGSDDDKRNENEQEQRVRHGEASLLRGANAGRGRLRRFPACLGRVGVD